MVSELLLNFIGTTSCKSFIIQDVSIYNPNLPVTCGQLEVNVPGFTYSHTFEVIKDFTLKVNAGNLGIQSMTSNKQLQPLPDGNYTIRYSINPNSQLFVEYNYYNTCSLYSVYMKQVCYFFNNKCDMTKTEQDKEIKRLFDLSISLDHIKISAEECDDVTTADNLYLSVKEKLNKNECKTCK